MLKVAVTGGIATGKTSLCKILEELGTEVIDLDSICKQFLKKGHACYREVVKAFGKRILKRDGSIDRGKLAKMVFLNKRRLTALNEAVHPFVIEEMKRMLKRGRGIMVVDFPLLFETRMEGEFDKVVVVYAQRSHQLHRLRRKGMEAKDALCRINAQLPMQKKLSKAHYIIDNRRAYSFLKAQAHTLYRKLLRCLQ